MRKTSRQHVIVDENLNDDERENIATLLLKPPRIPKSFDKISHFPKKGQIPDNAIHQIDLIFMPDDKEGDSTYKYILTVVDIGSRLIDCRPLTNKMSMHVFYALKDIYNKKSIFKEIPKIIHADNGKEFHGHFEQLFGNKIKIKYSNTNRHSSTAIVEAANREITKFLFKKMLIDEIKNKTVSTQWVSYLPECVEFINNKRRKIVPTKPNKFDQRKGIEFKSNFLFNEGDTVRYVLDYPIEALSGKRTDSKFRVGDVRYSNPTKISRVLFFPNQNIRYILYKPGTNKEMSNVSYADYQLLRS